MPGTLPEPMLTDAVRSPALPASSAAESKWDGFRAALSADDGQVVLRSRRGTQMAPAFPEVVAGAAQQPAHFVAFDVLRLADTTTLAWPYERRRAALEELFRERRLTAPWALCPSTTDPDTVREWLSSWTAVGMEGVVFKRLDSPYQASVRGWLKYKTR